jgi:hypothetical protein
MSKKSAHTVDEASGSLTRRSMLEQSVGVALGATVLGSLAMPAEAQQPVTAPPGTTPRVRRVVTGHNAQGKSYVISDDMVAVNELWKTSAMEPLGPWGPGEAPTILSNAGNIAADPPAGGGRWSFVTFLPAADPALKPTLQNRQRFHRTQTIDYALILSGEVVLLLDTQEVVLKAGDVVIQRNTYHSWRVDGTVPARLSMMMLKVG